MNISQSSKFISSCPLLQGLWYFAVCQVVLFLFYFYLFLFYDFMILLFYDLLFIFLPWLILTSVRLIQDRKPVRSPKPIIIKLIAPARLLFVAVKSRGRGRRWQLKDGLLIRGLIALDSLCRSSMCRLISWINMIPVYSFVDIIYNSGILIRNIY